MTAIKAVAICLGLYAIYLPAAWLAHRDYVLAPRPVGNPIEMLRVFTRGRMPDYYAARSLVFRTADFQTLPEFPSTKT